MGDDRTRRIIKLRQVCKLLGAAIVSSIIAGLAGVTFDWKPLPFVLARAEDLQRMAESLGLVMPQQGSAGYQFLDLAAAPVAGFLLGLAFARFPVGRQALDWLFPDPPHFLRSDLAAERERTMTLLEAPPPPFIGRHAEREALLSFAVGATSPFLWRAVVGPTGVGKSRLAVEWLQVLREAGWDAGVAASDMPVSDNWRPRQPTAIVLDEASREWAAALAPALAQLAAAARSRAPIRVLVVDTVEPNTDNVALAEQREAVRAARADALVVFGLDKDAFTTLWTAVHGPPRKAEQLTSLHDETAGRPRALLLLTRASPETSYWQALADWAVTLLPELADAPGSTAEAVDRKRLKALALSTLAGPLPVGAVRPALGGVFEAGPIARFFPAESLNSTLPALAPEDLAQEILLRVLALLDQPECKAIAQAAFCADPVAADRVERVLGSLWAERPECDAAIAATHGLEPDVALPVARRAKALAELQLAFDKAQPGHAAARREEAAKHAGATAASHLSLDDLASALECLEHIARRRPADREIRLQEVRGVVEAINRYGTAGRFEDMKRWERKLILLAATPAFLACREIRRVEARGAACAIHHHGNALRLDDLKQWGDRLIRIAEVMPFAADREIRLQEAKAAVNAISAYGRTSQFHDLEQWGDRLIHVAETEAFAADREFGQLKAQGAFYAILHYERAGRLDDLQRWEKLLTRLPEEPGFAAIDGIWLIQARAAVTAMTAYGRAGRFPDLERRGDRLIQLTEMPGLDRDREIRLVEAQGALNALVSYARYADRPRFSDLERWGDRLIRLAKMPEFFLDAEIRLLEAKAAMCVLSAYARVGSFVDVERWGDRLVHATDTPDFAADRKMQLVRAKAANNALSRYHEFGSGTSKASVRWCRRLRATARAFPEDLDIQAIAKNWAVSYADQMSLVAVT